MGRRFPALHFAFASILLAGCTVGPDYEGPPDVPLAQGDFARAGQAPGSAGPAQDRWWDSLKDPELDRLEDEALASSPDIGVARARLLESRAGLRQQQDNLLPSTTTNAVYLHSHGGTSGLFGAGAVSAEESGGSTANSDFDFYNVGFDATWEIDLFGGQRRAIESAAATAEERQADLADAQVTLTSDVAQAYIAVRDYQNRLRLEQNSVGLQQRTLDLERLRAQGGTASDLDVERVNTQVENTRAGLIPLQAQIEAETDRLSTLTGQPIPTLDADLAAPAVLPLPPDTVTVGDPTALLRHRPDIRAAEREIAAENAVIGERTADLFPKLTLLGNVGFGSTDVGSLLTGGSFTGIAAPVLQWSPFDFGRTRARIDQAEATRQEAIAHYDGTVLKALEDAETSLSRYGRQRQSVEALARVKVSADRAARLTQDRFEGGTNTLIDTLDAERQRLAAEQSFAEAQAELTEDFVSLQKSMGFGWTAE